MNLVNATDNDVNLIHNIVHTTINSIYSKYYPEDVVQFFLNHHSIENIRQDTIK